MSEIKLTANDPQPPPATVVRDDTGCRWYREGGRIPCGWISEHDSAAADPESWTKVAGNYGPVTVLRLPDGVETWPPAPKPAAAQDLAAQIRARLDGWAPPAAPDDAPPLATVTFPDTATPEEVEAWQRAWDELVAGEPTHRVHVVAPQQHFYPGFEQMRAAVLAVIDVHKPERRSIDTRSGTKVWHNCASCRDTDWNGPEVPWPCKTVEAIATALGIEVDGG